MDQIQWKRKFKSDFGKDIAVVMRGADMVMMQFQPRLGDLKGFRLLYDCIGVCKSIIDVLPPPQCAF